ncbi:hypothetical protein [Aminobacter sp. Piv2-1]|uniref:hypothetical protein n=1 Tax=Aminobacter sp. Piv2-1 TaxID=3031122 RepID=UPI0030B3B06D
MPVNKRLVNGADKLGNYLHAVNFRPVGDPWWTEFRELLIDTYRAAWVTCRGSLLCPPFLHKDGTTNLTIELDRGQEPQLNWQAYGMPGQTIVAKVEYPEAPPTDWQCDL